MSVNILKESIILSLAETKIPDCFVARNKIGSANGEAKLYVGASRIKDWNAFFNDFNIKGMFFKDDLLLYLDLARDEYEMQTQQYRRDISGDWQNYYNKINDLDDVIIFDFYHKEYVNKDRYYINSDSSIYKLFRQILLPIMSSVMIESIVYNNEHFALFRPFINEIGNVFENDIIVRQEKDIQNDVQIDATTKQQIILARKGQGKYRELILEKYNGTCAITKINDKRLLTASHIKPWAEATNEERINKENGILLSPTFDKLFDKGFISFKNNGNIILSNYFSDTNFKKLGIDINVHCDLKISNDMKEFLEYHRDQKFKA